MTDDAHAHEIVIIKRHGGSHEDAHHGGVWKIAFADFMTAMMAFFLVMWLISASDKTKAVIAKYFNPVELVDSTQQPPGLKKAKKEDPSVPRRSQNSGQEAEGKDVKTDEKTEAAVQTAPTVPSEAKPSAEVQVAPESKQLSNVDKPSKHQEAELNRDPYAVLAEIAAKSSAEPPKPAKAPPVEGNVGGAGAVGLKGGEAYRDPFEPMAATSPLAPEGTIFGRSLPSVSPGSATAVDEAQPSSATATPPDAPPATAAAAMTPAAAADPVAIAPPAAPAVADDKGLSVTALRAKIEALGKMPPATGGAAPAAGPRIDVRRTAEGLLISLTDDANFSMFASASAEPAAKMVALMEKIGTLLKSQKGSVTLRGFTDSRPFKSDTYDNWRLSTARAHMAHYMLVRGGLQDARIDIIEGYGDRRPRNPKDPEAAENRRIEILVRDTTP